jgi:hypothetical protein
MQNIVPLLLIVALAITGCDVQRGRFVSTGDTFEALSSPVGSLDIVDGYEKGGMDDQQILYVLIVTPSVEEHGSLLQGCLLRSKILPQSLALKKLRTRPKKASCLFLRRILKRNWMSLMKSLQRSSYSKNL